MVNAAPHQSTSNLASDNDESVQSSTYLSATDEQNTSDALFYDHSVTIYNSSAASASTIITTTTENSKGALRAQQAKVTVSLLIIVFINNKCESR